MSFLISYLTIGVLGIVLFISIDVMGGLEDNQNRWNGINPLKHFKEFWQEFKKGSSCLVSCSTGWKIFGLVVLFWPLIILFTLFELYRSNNSNKVEEENEKD